MQITNIYLILKNTYGFQGWWPLLNYKGTNPTKTGSINGYHPNIYNIKNKNIFEVCIGAILTQNTSWQNVEKALINLKKLNAINPKNLLKLNENVFAIAIKPAGYFNQKIKKIKLFANEFIKNDWENKTPKRNELLSIWGIGPETADSILLYGFNYPSFVVDLYTKRIFYRLGITNTENIKYDYIKEFVEKELTNFKDLNEFHALLVEHAKRHCLKKPICHNCPLKNICNFKS